MTFVNVPPLWWYIQDGGAIIFRLQMARRKNTGKKLNRLKEVLEATGKTQTWLSEQMDLDYETINRYSNNHRQPTLETLFEIAKLLKVNPKDLINS